MKISPQAQVYRAPLIEYPMDILVDYFCFSSHEIFLLDAMQMNDPISVKSIITLKKVNLNIKNANGVTPLMWAVLNNYPDIVKLILTKNVDVNLKDKSGFTAFFLAISTINLDIVKILIKTPKIDLNVKNKYNLSPLSYINYKIDLWFAGLVKYRSSMLLRRQMRYQDKKIMDLYKIYKLIKFYQHKIKIDKNLKLLLIGTFQPTSDLYFHANQGTFDFYTVKTIQSFLV